MVRIMHKSSFLVSFSISFIELGNISSICQSVTEFQLKEKTQTSIRTTVLPIVLVGGKLLCWF